MTQTPYHTYRDSELLNSSPERLVQVLYEIGIRAIEKARECCLNGQIAERGAHITKAFDVFVELQNGLNFELGGEMARSYARLYDYCQRRILEAHARQSEPMMAEVQSLLTDLLEAWRVVVQRSIANNLGEAPAPHLAQRSAYEDQGELAPRLSCVA